MEIRIYITNLAKYNAGYLVGKWVTLPLCEDELWAEVKAVLGEDEEHFITDYEAPFRIEEYDSLTDLNKMAAELEDMDNEDVKKALFLVNEQGYSFEDAIRKMDDVDYYPNMTLKDMAEQFVDEGMFGVIPDKIQGYIDYEAIARDLRFDYAETPDGCFRCD
jgi:antirestriction protein